jgi:ABC-type Fe3+ transport system substrate-binding protein
MTRRQVLARVASVGVVFGSASLLAACGSAAPAPAAVAQPSVAPAVQPSVAPATPAATTAARSSAAFDQLLAAAKQEGHVNLWSNVPTRAATLELLQQAFDQKFGGGIKIDQTPLSAGDAGSRLLAEAQAGRHAGDMAQPSPDIASNLIKAGLGVRRDWLDLFGAKLPNLRSAVQGVVVPELQGIGLAYWDVVYVLLYNTSAIGTGSSKLPRTWDDLADPQFASQLAVDVRGYPFNFLVLHPDWGEARTEKLVRAINASNPLKQPGAPQVSDAVVRGDAPLGVGSLADLAVQQKNGRPVQGVVLDYVPLNNLMAFVPAQPANPNAAQLFAAWMTSDGVAILEAQEFNGRLTDPSSQAHQVVYSQQANPKLAQVQTLDDMQRSAAFLKLAGNIYTGAA